MKSPKQNTVKIGKMFRLLIRSDGTCGDRKRINASGEREKKLHGFWVTFCEI